MIISSCELNDAKSNGDCEINKKNLKADLTDISESLQQVLSFYLCLHSTSLHGSYCTTKVIYKCSVMEPS